MADGNAASCNNTDRHELCIILFILENSNGQIPPFNRTSKTLHQGSTILERLRGKHGELAERFDRPVGDDGHNARTLYFVDHGLTDEQCVELREIVRGALKCKPLDSFDWQTAPLPLLVCAVEVGYRYEGNGTDFWPMLAAELQHDFSIDDRNRLSKWFDNASAMYGGEIPGTSDWEQAFCHIAWPITHAVAAKDIRRPFADCLRRFRRDVRNETLKDETIVGDLASMTTTVGSRRFRTWLERTPVVAGLVRDLLGGRSLDEAGLFTKSFRDRLIQDLRNEPEVRTAVRQVETARKTRTNKRAGINLPSAVDELRFGEFFLRQDEHGGLELCGELPELQKALRKSLKPIRRRWKARPWGFAGASPIPTECLRSTRGHFRLDFGYVTRATEETPFFSGFAELAIDEDARRWLESVRFFAAEMLAFPALDGGADATHSIGTPTPHRGKIWVLAQKGVVQSRRTEEDESHCQLIGEVDGGEVHEFDACNAQVRQWLGWPPAGEVSADTEDSFRWLLPSPISIGTNQLPVFTTDDEIGVSVSREKQIEVVLRKGAAELACQLVSSIATLSIEAKGSYELAVRESGLEIDAFSFVIADEKGDGFAEPDPEIPWQAVASHVDAGETDLTRHDLFNRRINLDIIGDRGIENLEARLQLTPGDAAVTVRLPRIPTRIAASDPLWDALCEQLPDAILKSPCDLLLSAEIQGLSNDTWRLESDLQELWWDESDGSLPTAVCDDGMFEVERSCILSGSEINLPKDGEPFLSVALDRDGNQLHFDARVDVIGDSNLNRQLVTPERFLRQMDDGREGIGLRTTTQRYLQLASGSSASLPAEVHRVRASQMLRDWVVEALCGPNYVHKRKEYLPIETISPVEIWWQCATAETSLLQPEPETGRSIPESLPPIVLAEFDAVLPDCWWDGSVPELDADDASPLDPVFQHLLGDESVFVDAEALTRSLRQAGERLCGGHLADLVVPAVAGDELLGWNLVDLSITESASQLHDWVARSLARGRGRRTWSVDELQAWLNLLLYPERLRKQPWESVVEKLLHDRPVARAGAFLAWRLEQTSRLIAFEPAMEA